MLLLWEILCFSILLTLLHCKISNIIENDNRIKLHYLQHIRINQKTITLWFF